MVFGAAGLLLHNVPLMLTALAAMGVHSTFFGPIKYAILPQHLTKDEVLGGTGLVEAGTYIGILSGTILGGLLVLQRPDGSFHAEFAAVGVLVVALIGRVAGGFVPPAPPADDPEIPGYPHRGMDWHIVRASITLVSATLHVRRLFLAILCDQLLLGDGRGSGRAIPAAGEEHALRRPERRDLVPRRLLGRRRDRLGGDQPHAEGPGLRPLRAVVRPADGRVRPPALRVDQGLDAPRRSWSMCASS